MEKQQKQKRKSVLNIHWKDWCWSWNSNTSATWWEKLINLKRPWHWERLKVGGEGDDRGWGGWMASLTQWTWVWVNSGSWWWTGRPGVLQSMGSQKSDTTEWLNWTNACIYLSRCFPGYSVVKNLSANSGDTLLYLILEDPVEKEIATHSSFWTQLSNWKTTILLPIYLSSIEKAQMLMKKAME